MEKRPPLWRVAANIFNKKSRTADKGGPPAGVLGEVLTTPRRKTWHSYETQTRASGPDLSFGTT
jgi:hypothetical protein